MDPKHIKVGQLIYKTAQLDGDSRVRCPQVVKVTGVAARAVSGINVGENGHGSARVRMHLSYDGELPGWHVSRLVAIQAATTNLRRELKELPAKRRRMKQDLELFLAAWTEAQENELSPDMKALMEHKLDIGAPPFDTDTDD